MRGLEPNLSGESELITTRIYCKHNYWMKNHYIIDCEEVENFYHVTRWQLTDLDWLAYHAPIEYAGLVLPGRIKSYLNGTTLHGMESE